MVIFVVEGVNLHSRAKFSQKASSYCVVARFLGVHDWSR